MKIELDESFKFLPKAASLESRGPGTSGAAYPNGTVVGKTAIVETAI